MQRTLTDMAESAPIARVGDDVWRRGRRRRTRRRLVHAALALTLVLSPAAFVLQSGWERQSEPATAEDDPLVLPVRIGRAQSATSTLDEAPNGPAIAAFNTPITLRLGTAVTEGVALIGRDGSYRVLPKTVDNQWLLSPDGRLLARHGELVNLIDAGREAIPEARHLLAWDRTGKRLLYADGSDLYLRDVEAHAHRKLSTLASQAEAAAFSPDGSRLAVTWGGRLHVLDVQSGAEQWSANMDGHMAGQAAWTPDSQRVTLLQVQEPRINSRGYREPSQWRLGFVGPSGRAEFEQEWQRGWAHHLAGWLGGDPVVALHDLAEHDGIVLLRTPLGGGDRQLLTVFQTTVPHVAWSIIERADFGGRPLAQGFDDFQRSFYAAATVLLVVTCLVILVPLFLRRRRRA
ncbi:WD40 repeat domain-containing protein [Allorhizocola rhizosphaerae]|uniref:WD40 repeat domain-containing protein n=1 Tax=Allorhizocola rhizosphaerae TaxID=1872709 RepID=UPI0013C32D1C|nr:PD40 domain-containing protein [Allorhizocola rhizosphaerae]